MFGVDGASVVPRSTSESFVLVNESAACANEEKIMKTARKKIVVLREDDREIKNLRVGCLVNGNAHKRIQVRI